MRQIVMIVVLYLITALVSIAQRTIITTDGKKIFESNCSRCHGIDGTLGKFGAKNLRKSKLNDQEYVSIISNGKSMMPKWKKKLSEAEITAVIRYVKSFRN